MTNNSGIVAAYVRRIKRGGITIDDVPDSIKDAVKKAQKNS